MEEKGTSLLRNKWQYCRVTDGGGGSEQLPEVLGLSDESSLAAQHAVVLIPGNPGIPHFYCNFGECLQTALSAEGADGQTWAVYCVGMTNFTVCEARAGQVATIKEEAERLVPVLEGLSKKHTGGLLLVGHSIGAWAVLQHIHSAVMQKSGPLAGVKVHAAVFATPYLEFNTRSMNQRWLRWLFRQWFTPSLVTCVTSLLSHLPEGIQRTLSPLVGDTATEIDRDIVKATIVQQPHQLEGIVFMAKSEFEYLDAGMTSGIRQIEELIKEDDCPPLVGVFTASDHWGPETHKRRLEAMVSMQEEGEKRRRLSVLDAGNVQHSFVLRPQQSAAVAKLIVRSVCQSH